MGLCVPAPRRPRYAPGHVPSTASPRRGAGSVRRPPDRWGGRHDRTGGPGRPGRAGPGRHRPASRRRDGTGGVALVRRRLGAAAARRALAAGRPAVRVGDVARTVLLPRAARVPVLLAGDRDPAAGPGAERGARAPRGLRAGAGRRERADAVRRAPRPDRGVGRGSRPGHAARADRVVGDRDLARAGVPAAHDDLLLRRRAGGARHRGAGAAGGAPRPGVGAPARGARTRRRVHDRVEPAVRAVVSGPGGRHPRAPGAGAPGALASGRAAGRHRHGGFGRRVPGADPAPAVRLPRPGDVRAAVADRRDPAVLRGADRRPGRHRTGRPRAPAAVRRGARHRRRHGLGLAGPHRTHRPGRDGAAARDRRRRVRRGRRRRVRDPALPAADRDGTAARARRRGRAHPHRGPPHPRAPPAPRGPGGGGGRDGSRPRDRDRRGPRHSPRRVDRAVPGGRVPGPLGRRTPGHGRRAVLDDPTPRHLRVDERRAAAGPRHLRDVPVARRPRRLPRRRPELRCGRIARPLDHRGRGLPRPPATITHCTGFDVYDYAGTAGQAILRRDVVGSADVIRRDRGF